MIDFGRDSEEKGVKTLLDVCRKLLQIPFVFAGKGPLEDEVTALPNVENRGFLSGKELYQTIAEASFVVFPSECYENCPFSVMEAQLYKTPVIASKIGEYRSFYRMERPESCSKSEMEVHCRKELKSYGRIPNACKHI